MRVLTLQILAASLVWSSIGCESASPTNSIDSDASSPETCAPNREVAPAWQVLSVCRPEGQLLSVIAPTRDNVWAVGANGQIVHFDGCDWSRYDPGVQTDLWWVSITGNTLFIVGENGTILRSKGEGADRTFELMPSPTDVTLFGVYAASEQDVWAVGFAPLDPEPTGTLLHYDGQTWSSVELPSELQATRDMFKVWGRNASDVWVVGRDGLALRYDGVTWSSIADNSSDWVTVTGDETQTFTVGGRLNGELALLSADAIDPVALDAISPLQGICVGPAASGFATGLFGAILKRRQDGSWTPDETAPLDLFSPSDPPVTGCNTFIPDYHACAISPDGGTFLVGGNFAGGLRDGVLLYYGTPIPPLEL